MTCRKIRERPKSAKSVRPCEQKVRNCGGDTTNIRLQGTILTKATEYIHQLERRNKQITQEHRELAKKLQAFEQLLNHTAATAYQMPAYSRTLFDPRGFC